MAYNDFRSFEELERSIKKVGEKWVSESYNLDGEGTYKGQWAQLVTLDRFIKTEQANTKKKLNEMKGTYSDAFLREHGQRIEAELKQFVEKAKEEQRNNVRELAEKKHKKVVEMLTATPTAEQVRFLDVLRMRKDLDAVEMQNILPTFFKNYHAMRVLDTISKENGITLHIPVQLDCRVMFENIRKATDRLLGAINEIGKPHDKQELRYKAFLMLDPEHPDTCHDPIYNGIIEAFDTIPQLNDVKTEKSGLNAVERMKVDWYYKDADMSNKQGLIEHTERVINENPEIVPLLKYTPYGEYLDIIAKARAEGKDE